MIRRISKNNDLKDLIKSCPSGVIDDITEIRYFISGHPETEIVATFEKVGSHLEAILPTSDLATLGNGVLMRRALYKVSDPAYPDGYYNLEFVDNLDVWLGDEETEDPFDPGYLTESDLKTINGESLVGVGNIDVVNYIPDYYATKSWVSGQGYITSSALTGYATQSWVSSQQFATQGWVENKSYASITYVQNIISSVESGIVTDLSSYATQSWVEAQGYITSNPDLSPYATKSWVSEQGYLTSVPSEYATQSWVRGQNYYIEATDDPVVTDSKLWYVIGGEGEDNPFVRENTMLFAISASLTGYATQSWVSSQQFATQSWVQSQGYITSAGLSGLATQSWVLDQGYITSETLPEDIATQSWVESYVYECDFAGAADVDVLSRWVVSQNYATQSWVSSQQFATQSWVSSNFLSATTLTGYATESWVSSNYVSTTTLSSYTTFRDIDSYISSFWYRAAEEFYSDYVPRSEVGSYLSGYATESWVSSQQFITSAALTGYATQSWVESQGYLTSHQDLTGYATESWVQSQGYLSEVPSSYATQSWVETNYFEESKIWTGTQSQWEQLTSAQQALYRIALVY